MLIGASTEGELAQALAAEASGRLSSAEMKQAAKLALSDPDLLNPATWSLN